MLSALAFALAFVGCALLALLRHPIYGLYLYLGVFYIHPPSRWWSQMLPDLRWSFLSGVIAIVALVIHRQRLQKLTGSWASTAPGFALVVLVAWLWVQNLWALDPESQLRVSVQYSKYIVAFYLVYRVADQENGPLNVLLLHVAGCFFLGLLCFYHGRDFGARLDGVGGPGIDDANTLGMFLVTGVLAGAMIVLADTGWRRVVVVLMMPVVLNGVILTGSRGAFLGLVAGSAVLFFLRPPRRTWLFVSAGALGLMLAASLVDQKFIDRMFSIKAAAKQTEEMDSSAESRLVLMQAQIMMAASYPHGAGHRGTAELSPQYLDERWLTRSSPDGEAARSSHNTFLTLLVEQGWLGAAIYLWITLWGFGTLIRLRRLQSAGAPIAETAPAAACCAAIAAVWTAGQFTDYLLAEVQIWMFALLALSLERVQRTVAGARRSSAPRIGEQATAGGAMR